MFLHHRLFFFFPVIILLLIYRITENDCQDPTAESLLILLCSILWPHPFWSSKLAWPWDILRKHLIPTAFKAKDKAPSINPSMLTRETTHFFHKAYQFSKAFPWAESTAPEPSICLLIVLLTLPFLHIPYCLILVDGLWIDLKFSTSCGDTLCKIILTKY